MARTENRYGIEILHEKFRTINKEKCSSLFGQTVR